MQGSSNAVLQVDGEAFVWNAPQAAFQPMPDFPGVFRGIRPVLPEGVDQEGVAETLEVDGVEVPALDGDRVLAALEDPELFDQLRAATSGGGWFGVGDSVFLLSDAEAISSPIVHRTHLARGFERAGRWYVAVGRYGAQGLSVLPGESTTIHAEHAGVLRFATVVRGALGGETTFRVLQAGRELVRSTSTPRAAPTLVRHAVDVVPGELTFEVTGTLAHTAFLSPVIAPKEIGNYAERPWGDDRPDLIVFLADTFRADNLATYGGAGLETPNLDASLERALVMERAWSPSSWTLPSHASLFTGLFPYQHGAISALTALGEEAVTLAEQLAAAGYRTGAITDAGFVTRSAGLDQGFEWYDEDWGDLDDSLDHAAAFLDADDGRPVFLFFQTYRAHTPYVPDERQLEELKQRLDLSRSFVEVQKSIYQGDGWVPRRDPSVHVPEELTRYRDLYRSAVAAVDLGWGRFESILAERSLFDSGITLVTSDHGEAFWEHGELGHGNGIFEEHLRVPFAFLGRGIEPGRISRAANLVDVPRTLTRLVGVDAAPDWLGHDLFALDHDPTTFAWECNHRGFPSSRTRIEANSKWIFEQDSEKLEAAYELGQDPGETVDVAEKLRPGAEDSLRELELLELPRVGPGRASYGPSAAADLRALGYAGGD